MIANNANTSTQTRWDRPIGAGEYLVTLARIESDRAAKGAGTGRSGTIAKRTRFHKIDAGIRIVRMNSDIAAKSSPPYCFARCMHPRITNRKPTRSLSSFLASMKQSG